MKKLFIVLFFIPALLFSQELDAKVTVNYQQLPSTHKDKLQNFEQAISDYLNNTQFTNLELEGDKIKCSFNIFFKSATGDNEYQAQAVITSQRPIYKSESNSLMLNINDDSWNFEYQKNQSINFNQLEFDPITSFLDFYAYMIIGYDMDSYQEFGGSDFYQKAFEIAVRGGSSSYSQGWETSSSSYNKRSFVADITNAQFEQFRKDFYDYHYNGIDIYKQKKRRAQQNIAKLINNLYEKIENLNPRSSLLRVFFNAKSGEIVDYMRDYPDVDIFKKLKKIDPSHISKYNEVLDSRK
jgi:hypothetical protein